MYVLRDEENYEFLSEINRNEIETEENLSYAMIFKTLEEAEALNNYFKIINYNCFEICEIKFEVKE